MKRYSIIVRECFADREVELCQVETNPEDVCAALAGKRVGGKAKIRKYETIRIKDNGRWQNIGRSRL